MYVVTYVCMYVYMYVCMFMYVVTNVCVCMYVCIPSAAARLYHHSGNILNYDRRAGDACVWRQGGQEMDRSGHLRFKKKVCTLLMTIHTYTSNNESLFLTLPRVSKYTITCSCGTTTPGPLPYIHTYIQTNIT